MANNAGASFGVPNLFHTYNEADWLRTIDVNLHSVFRVTRAVLPLMMNNGGSIINTASRAGKVPPLFNGAYAVAKAGLIMLTKVMAQELAGMNIRVNAICPGQVMTDLEKWRFGLEAQFFSCTIEEREQAMCQTIPLRRIGSPEEVANLVAFLASSGVLLYDRPGRQCDRRAVDGTLKTVAVAGYWLLVAGCWLKLTEAELFLV